MSSKRAFVAALAWGAALAVGCGGLADGHYQGQPLAVIQGTLKRAGPVEIAGETSFALLWAPAANHDAVLNFLGGAASGPVPDSAYTETCSDAVPPTQPLCDGTAAKGDRNCDWTDRRLASLVRVVGYEAHLPEGFEIPVRDLPPESAMYDLSQQGGTGWFALASLVAFDDQDRDGVFRLGGPGSPPEPTLASSGRQTYVPRPGQPRRSYLIAFVDGVVDPEHIDPAFAEVLLFLPQGFSLWVEDEWLDGYGRTTASGRLWQPIDAPIELVMPTQAVAGCEKGTRQATYLPGIPPGEAPTWCSDDRFRATWSRASTSGCVTVEERYSADFSCGGSLPPAWSCPAPTTSSLVVTVATTGQDLHPDGYDIRLDGGASQAIGSNASLPMPVVAPGSHTVAIGGLAGNCAVVGANTAQVTVAAGGTAYVAFSVECWRPGAIGVGITVNGRYRIGTFDPDGVTVSVDGGPSTPVMWSSVTFPDLRPGTHVVSLSGLVSYCQVVTGNPLMVEVLPGATTDASFAVDCAPPTGQLRVTVTTTGADLPAAHQLRVDSPDYPTRSNFLVFFDGPISPNTSVLLSVPVGRYRGLIYGLAPNCSSTSPADQTALVTEGQTADLLLTVECQPLGSLTVTNTTTGVEFAPSGYWFSWSGPGQPGGVLQGGGTLATNGSGTVAGLYAGEYQVTLGDLPRNCSLSGPNPRTVTVASGQNTDVPFAVDCVTTGSLAVTTTTSGVDVDHDGYRVVASVAGTVVGYWSAPADGTTSVTGLLPGVYQLTLSQMAANCEAAPATVTVVAGATTAVTFDVICQPDRGLAFTFSDGVNVDIAFIHSNGTGLQRLTVHPANDIEPAWSPDGARLAFASDRDGNYEIYVMNADGSNQTPVTNGAAPAHHPAWSPDGKRIAFESDRSGSPEIYVIDDDGSNLMRLTASPGVNPDWSPDGSRIAFRMLDWLRGIHVMNADGSGATRITADPDDRWPDWSPDGTKIALLRRSIMVVNADGSGERSVNGPWADGCWLGWDAVRWSPDGRHFVALTFFSPRFLIMTMRADGTNCEFVTEGVDPAWRP